MREGARNPFGRSPRGFSRALAGITLLSLACLLSAWAQANPAIAAPARGAAASSAASAPLSSPRNLKVRSRSGSSITLRWMRARGGRRPHTFLVFVNGRRRAVTRRKGARITRLRCGTRYRIDVATRDARGRTSKRKTRMVRTSRCTTARRAPGSPWSHPDPPARRPEARRAEAPASRSPDRFPAAARPPAAASRPAVAAPTASVPRFRRACRRRPARPSMSRRQARTPPPAARRRRGRRSRRPSTRSRPGRRVLIHGGVYSQDLELNRGGSAAAPITIRNAPRRTGDPALPPVTGCRSASDAAPPTRASTA